MSDQGEKVRENRLRRAAERQGLRLEKSRRRDPRALDYHAYHLVNVATNEAEASGLGLDEVEARLAGQGAIDPQALAFDKLLGAVAVLEEFWEDRSTGDQLDDVDLMDIVLNAAEHASAGGGQPVCGHSRVVSGREVSEGGNYAAVSGRLYETSSAVCGRVAGHGGYHRGDNNRWTDDTPDWD